MNYKRKKRMSREDRKQYIIRAFEWKIGERVSWATMYDVAKWVGMKPSNHLMKYLHELVGEGRLSVYVDDYRPGVKRHWFSTTESMQQTGLFRVGAGGDDADQAHGDERIYHAVK